MNKIIFSLINYVTILLIISSCFFFSLENNLEAASGGIKLIKIPPKQSDRKMAFGLSGGYFMPMGELGSALNAAPVYRAYFQYNGIVKKFIGFDLETGYTGLNDKEYDSGIKLMWAIPSVSYNLELPWTMLIQVKLGAGAAMVKANQDYGKGDLGKSSTDLAMSAGLSILKSIRDRVIVGIEERYYHFFESVAGNGHAVNFVLGVKF